MDYAMDEKWGILFQRATAALKRRDWELFREAACYDAHTGNQIIRLYEEQIPVETKCEIALFHYSNNGDFYPTLRKYVRKAGIIRPDNWREALPVTACDLEIFTIYRGGGEEISRAPYALSWTLSREVAEWFMKRHEVTHPGPQHLYCGMIAADKVILYCLYRVFRS